MLQVGYVVYKMKKQMDDVKVRAKKEETHRQNQNSKDVIDAEFRVISEEK